MSDRIANSFLGWWGRELAALLPPRLRQALARRPLLLVEISGRELLVYAARRGAAGSERLLGRVPLAAADAVARLRHLSRGRRSGGALLRLPAAAVLRRRIALPEAARENLREVLEFEMDRFTPFTAEQVVFDYRIIGRRPNEPLLDVELVVAPRADLAPALSLLAAAGLGPARVEAEASSGADFDLLPPELAGRRSTLSERLAGGLALLALLLGLASLVIEVRQQRHLQEELQAALADAKREAAEVEGLRQELAKLRAGGDRLAERRRKMPPVLLVLKEVTDRLPDDSWAVEFELSGEALTLSGFSTRAARLIALLEDSPLLTDVRFESSVTMEPRIGLERYLLTARAQGGE